MAGNSAKHHDSRAKGLCQHQPPQVNRKYTFYRLAKGKWCRKPLNPCLSFEPYQDVTRTTSNCCFFWETPIKSSTGKFPLSIWKSFRNGRVCHFATNAARDFDQYSWLLYLQKLASTTHSLQRLETCEYIHGLWKYGTHIENRHQNRHGLIIHSQHFLRSSSRTCAAPHPSTSCQLSWEVYPVKTTPSWEN